MHILHLGLTVLALSWKLYQDIISIGWLTYKKKLAIDFKVLNLLVNSLYLTEVWHILIHAFNSFFTLSRHLHSAPFSKNLTYYNIFSKTNCMDSVFDSNVYFMKMQIGLFHIILQFFCSDNFKSYEIWHYLTKEMNSLWKKYIFWNRLLWFNLWITVAFRIFSVLLICVKATTFVHKLELDCIW